MATPMYRVPNEVVYDGGMVVNSLYFPPELSYRVRDFAMGTEDVLIVTYPKAGTTWVQELTYLVNNEADVDKAMSAPIFVRSKFLEMNIPGFGAGVDMIPHDPHPWIMKSHLPVRYFTKQLEEKKVKVIVVMRNPMDNLVSFFHFHRNNEILGNFPGTWDEFFDLIKAKHLQNGDIFEWNAGWWSQRNNENVLILKFEDMKKDIRGVIRQVAQHCCKTFDAAGIEKIANRVSLETMRNNPTINPALITTLPFKVTEFLRKGEVGDWRNYFSPEQKAYIMQRCDQVYKPVGLEFSFD